ncbi:MAG: hypothetical protein O2812_03665 [Chloroflexi bacterium]|nr:hypothetical protein [Chloroflexota bacterium]
MLDCHPVAESLEARVGQETTQLGPLEYSPAFIRTIENADQALTSLCNNGTFLNQQQLEYVVSAHFSSIDEWEEYWAGQAEYYVPPEDGLFENMRQLLAEPGAELLLHNQIKAICFTKPT